MKETFEFESILIDADGNISHGSAQGWTLKFENGAILPVYLGAFAKRPIWWKGQPYKVTYKDNMWHATLIE